jgi:hypothetical protein
MDTQLLALVFAFALSAPMFPAMTLILSRLAGWRLRRPLLFI